MDNEQKMKAITLIVFFLSMAKLKAKNYKTIYSVCTTQKFKIIHYITESVKNSCLNVKQLF